jgi:hypothetical protein
MNQKISTLLFVIAVFLTGAADAGNFALAQTPTASAQVASKADQELAADSKKAIIETGISEPYFNEHFRLLKVVNEAGDRHVEWKYSINEYETMLVDDVGYYTSDAGQRVDVHSIKNELFSASDIKKTIPRSKADAALKSCIGEHRDAIIIYRSLKAPGKAGLYLSARSKTPLDNEKEKEKEEEAEIEGLFFNVAFIDLETGKCSVERGKLTP